MTDSIKKLIEISSDSLSEEDPYFDNLKFNISGVLKAELQEMLRRKNGFYAFEAALHVLPSTLRDISPEMTLIKWNDVSLWKNEFTDENVSSSLFFAEDIFGVQFCVKDDAIYTFDPETCEFEEMCSSLEEWALTITKDYEVLTGFPVAHEWQVKHGRIQPNSRLLPKVPFICGGEFNIDNMHEVESVRGMKFRASIARQVQNLPDGAKLKLVLE